MTSIFFTNNILINTANEGVLNYTFYYDLATSKIYNNHDFNNKYIEVHENFKLYDGDKLNTYITVNMDKDFYIIPFTICNTSKYKKVYTLIDISTDEITVMYTYDHNNYNIVYKK